MSGGHCRYQSCDAPASRVPQLVLRARDSSGSVRVLARAKLEAMALCRDHARVLIPDDFVTERAWLAACDFVKAKAGALPDRKLLAVEMLPIAKVRTRLLPGR